MKIEGRILSGARQGAFFLQLDWVQKQCMEKLGFKPYPGTLNLEIGDNDVPLLEALLRQKGIEMVPEDSSFCSGMAFPVFVEGISGAIIAPAEKVRIHARNIIEIIAPLNLKKALNVDDGDRITLTVDYTEAGIFDPGETLGVP